MKATDNILQPTKIFDTNEKKTNNKKSTRPPNTWLTPCILWSATRNPNCINKIKWPSQLNIWISFSSSQKKSKKSKLFAHIFNFYHKKLFVSLNNIIKLRIQQQWIQPMPDCSYTISKRHKVRKRKKKSWTHKSVKLFNKSMSLWENISVNDLLKNIK